MLTMTEAAIMDNYYSSVRKFRAAHAQNEYVAEHNLAVANHNYEVAKANERELHKVNRTVRAMEEELDKAIDECIELRTKLNALNSEHQQALDILERALKLLAENNLSHRLQ